MGEHGWNSDCIADVQLEPETNAANAPHSHQGEGDRTETCAAVCGICRSKKTHKAQGEEEQTLVFLQAQPSGREVMEAMVPFLQDDCGAAQLLGANPTVRARKTSTIADKGVRTMISPFESQKRSVAAPTQLSLRSSWLNWLWGMGGRSGKKRLHLVRR